ncbi:hypothetical protein [Mesorhizobium sp. M0715]|uniref:hypothetical protein n=1 Tax=Mesorhizobium sp. M0715 TaxID=2956990 RepID=UPI00333B9743
MKTVACVLRSGGDFEPGDVVRLFNQVSEHLPGAKFRCFSDVAVQGVEVIPLRHGWPRWWAKMELFLPELPDDWLFFDLDTSIVDSLADMAEVEGPVIMRERYWPGPFTRRHGDPAINQSGGVGGVHSRTRRSHAAVR